MRHCIRRARQVLAVGLGLMALASPGLRASDTTVQASPAEIAMEKASKANLEKALATDPKNLAMRIQLGRVLSDLGAFGDEDASDAAVELLKTLHKEQPKDAAILAFYGNACTIYAQYSSIFTKLSWVHDGFNYMDAAEKAAPDDIDVRVTRAINSSQVPGFLGREKIAREDFDWLLKRIHSNPKDFSADLQRTIYYFNGKFLLEHGEAAAVQVLAQAEAVPPPANDTLEPKIVELLKAARAKFPPAPSLAKAS